MQTKLDARVEFRAILQPEDTPAPAHFQADTLKDLARQLHDAELTCKDCYSIRCRVEIFFEGDYLPVIDHDDTKYYAQIDAELQRLAAANAVQLNPNRP